MTLELLEAVQNGTLRVAELRKYPRDALTARIETPLGATTLLHQLMLVGNERLVRAALEIVGTDRPAHYMALDADNSTPVHAFAQRLVGGAARDALTKAVIDAVPLAALRAVNKDGNTPVHLFPLCGNAAAVALCRARDPALCAVQNSYHQTPTELALERQRVESESALKALRSENRRLAHNQSMADADEEKLREFYARMDAEMKRRDEQEATLRREAEKSTERIKALEAIALTKERVMREAIARREEAERDAARLKKQLAEAGATQTAAHEAVERTRAELAARERDVAERSAALTEAFNEIRNLEVDTGIADAAVAAAQQRKLALAEARAAELQAQHAAEKAARDRVADELHTKQTMVERLQTELDDAKRRFGEIETKSVHAVNAESAARARFDEMRGEVERVQAEERRAFEAQIASLREQNERNRAEMSKLQLSGDEAKKLRETLDAERERTEQWRQAHEESELRVKTLITELEAEQTRPVSVPQLSPRSLQRRPSSQKISTAVAAAAAAEAANGAADALTTPRSRASVGLAPAGPTVTDEGTNERFFNNVLNRVLECDCDTMGVLVSPKLELDIGTIVDRTGAGLLELFLMKTLQANYVVTAATTANKPVDAATSARVERAPDMFELLVRAGARWNGLPTFIAEHRVRLPKTLTAKFDVYEQWWAFADALLAGERTKDAHLALARLLPTIGDPNHILTQFHAKTAREHFAGREMSYLHLALELYNEQALSVVELLLSVPGIDANLCNAQQMTPLHTAINRFHKTAGRCAALVEALMAAGADPLRPCDNSEIIEQWAQLAGDAVPKHSGVDADKQTRREASETASRAKLLQRGSKSTRSLRASQTIATDDQTWLVTATNRYTTPLAMAKIVGNERLIELLTHERYRRVETRTLTAMIVDRAMMHHWLLEAFERGTLSRRPLVAKYFELLHHVPHCFNPYTTSVIVATGVRPRVLKTKLAVGLAQSLVDVEERQIVETITHRLDDPHSFEAKAVAVAASSSTTPPATPRSRFGSLVDAHQALEQIVADLEGNEEFVAVWQLASALLRIVRAAETFAYDVSAPILASAVARYDEAVEQAICAMIERRSPPAAFVYVVARDDAQFGPRVCYDSLLPTLRPQRTVLQALVASGDVAKLEAIYARAPEALDHRFANDRALLKLAIESHQPLVIAWMDYVGERAATARRRAFESRTVKTSSGLPQAALRRAGVERDAKQCQAPNREHYALITAEGSTVLHLCVEALRDDLLDFVLSSAFAQLQKCDARGRRPVELAIQIALNEKLSTSDKEALARCTALLRGSAHLLVTPLVLPTSTAALEAMTSPRKSPAAPSVTTTPPLTPLKVPKSEQLLSPRVKKERSTPRSKADDEQADPDAKWETITLTDAESISTTTTPRSGTDELITPRKHRHRHRSSCVNKDK